MLQRKACENIYALNRYRRLFIENDLSIEKENKICKIISLNKSKIKIMKTRVTRVNMLTKDTKTYLKTFRVKNSYSFCRSLINKVFCGN